ncbi:hypothetical protein HDU86_007255 [Geranomyces michiganensis]|nr:hypothetical protein HDU86_007255 [Geranomyces michiganensis]
MDAANVFSRVAAAAAAAWKVQQEAMAAAAADGDIDDNCNFWQRDACSYGPSCCLIHAQERDRQQQQQHPLPPTPAPQLHRPSAFTKPLARISPLALAPNGYMHQQQIQAPRYTTYASPAALSLQPTASGHHGGGGNGGGGGGGPVSTRSVCRYWLQGICNRGPACRFLHGAAAPAVGDARHSQHHRHHHNNKHHHHHNNNNNNYNRHPHPHPHRDALHNHHQQQNPIHNGYHHHTQQNQSSVLLTGGGGGGARPNTPRPRPRSFDIRYLPTTAYAIVPPSAAAQTGGLPTAPAAAPMTGRLRAYTYPPVTLADGAQVMDAEMMDDGFDNCGGGGGGGAGSGVGGGGGGVMDIDGDDCGSVDDFGLPFDLDEWDDFAGGGDGGGSVAAAVAVDGGVLHGGGGAATTASPDGSTSMSRIRDLRSIWEDGNRSSDNTAVAVAVAVGKTEHPKDPRCPFARHSAAAPTSREPSF